MIEEVLAKVLELLTERRLLSTDEIISRCWQVPAEMAVLVAFGGVVAGAAVQSLRDELREFI
jgi:hypothetical protein